jgi:hypothetical protein
MASCGLPANSDVSNSSTLLAILMSAFCMAIVTACAAKSAVAAFPNTMLVATFIADAAKKYLAQR